MREDPFQIHCIEKQREELDRYAKLHSSSSSPSLSSPFPSSILTGPTSEASLISKKRENSEETEQDNDSLERLVFNDDQGVKIEKNESSQRRRIKRT